MKPILKEIIEMNDRLNLEEVNEYVNALTLDLKNIKNDNIIGIAAGRMGYSLRSFIMRLSHMGFNASMIGDTNVPKVRNDTVMIVNSSSGETPSILNYAIQSSSKTNKIYSTTCNNSSSIALLSKKIISIPEIKSQQLMKSPYEQFSMLLYDFIVIKLVETLELDKKYISNNHSILE